MIKCVVFDFDGTLVDSNDIKRQTFLEIARPWDPAGEIAAEVLELWPAADRYAKTRRIAEGLMSRKLLPADSSVDSWATRLADEYTTRCENAIVRCPEMPGATRALEDLAGQGLCLFVNSATPVGPLQRLLKLRNWSGHFQAVYGAEACKADNLKQISRQTGAAPKSIIHIGDQADDQQAAEQFGCHFAAMGAANSGPAARTSALVIRDLRELSTMLMKLEHQEVT